MLRNELTRIKIGQTDEPLTGQGGFLAYGEYMRGMKVRERVNTHLPPPGSNRGFDPGVFVQTLVTLLTLADPGGTDLVGPSGPGAGKDSSGTPGSDGHSG